jgi:hypothetical protein
MYFLRKLRTSKKVSTLILAAGLVSVPAFAQITLTADQLAAIEGSLRAALQAAASQGSEAIEAAISNAEQASISLYGSGNTSGITSIIIQTSEKQSVDQCTIGRGLAKAAGGLAPANISSAQAIAGSLSNEGAAMERNCFKTAMERAGYTQLAALVDQNPTVTGGITGGTGGQGGIGQGGLGGGFTGGNPGGAGGGCLNPSCTKLDK